MKISFDLDDNIVNTIKEDGKKNFRNLSQQLRWIILKEYADLVDNTSR